MSLEEAIYKMTGKAAGAMHITDRGQLSVGKRADINIFDRDTVLDVGTYTDPRQYAVGFDKVIVNGVVVLSGQTVNEQAACGQVIRI